MVCERTPAGLAAARDRGVKGSLKHAARGFGSFQNFRIRILFFCGRLNLYPTTN